MNSPWDNVTAEQLKPFIQKETAAHYQTWGRRATNAEYRNIVSKARQAACEDNFTKFLDDGFDTSPIDFDFNF